MQTRFDEALHAQVTVDDQQRIRQINYFDQLLESESEPQTAREAAEAYVRSVAGALDVPEAQLSSLQESASFIAPRQEAVQYRVSEEKTLFDSTTVGYAQTVNNVHTESFFQTVEGLGFPQATYFNGTDFPVEIDHRGLGTVINAHCVGNGADGIDHCCYALGDTTDLANPLGRACDSRVHWREIGGHGVLYEHVNSPNFGFSHSAGDGLSAIFHNPESKAPDRFRYAPWNPVNLRRFDRTVAAGWAGAERTTSAATAVRRFWPLRTSASIARSAETRPLSRAGNSRRA